MIIRSTPWLSLLALVGSECCLVLPTWAQSPEEEALEEVRQGIQALQNRLARQHEAREQGEAALRAAELAIADASKELTELRARNEAARQRQAALARDSRVARVRLEAERGDLAQQVRMSYMSGRQEMLKLLLNQESPTTLGRMLVYYDYLNRARSVRVSKVTANIEALARLAEETEQVARDLTELERAQAIEVESLNRARDERRSVLRALDTDISRSGGEIERLEAEEERLTALVAEVHALLAGFPLSSEAAFPTLRGALAWPVPGTLLGDFGQLRAGGEVTWNGVLLGAPAGTPVRAIYHGRVAYADWLPGLGLLVIVDHGGGYMSLYGHNEAILKESGAWVTPGEVIAQVGDSGGQARTALYFEIRRNGEPVNPHPWIGHAEGGGP